MSRDEDGPSLPLRATGIVLSVWVVGLLVVTFVVVPFLFSFCGTPL